MAQIVFLSITSPRGPFHSYWVTLVGVYFNAAGIAYIVSIVTPPALSQLVGVVCIFACSMYAGGGPVLAALYEKFIPLCWIPYISFMRYSLEALYVQEVVQYRSVVELQHVNLDDHVHSTLGYDTDAFARDVAILFAFGFFWRLVGVVLMVVWDREKKV